MRRTILANLRFVTLDEIVGEGRCDDALGGVEHPCCAAGRCPVDWQACRGHQEQCRPHGSRFALHPTIGIGLTIVCSQFVAKPMLPLKSQVACCETCSRERSESGTHTGEWNGLAPTGKPIQFQSMIVHRIADGKVVEGSVGVRLTGLDAAAGLRVGAATAVTKRGRRQADVGLTSAAGFNVIDTFRLSQQGGRPC